MNHDYAIHVLKLPPTFSVEQLRANYKRMALLLHPDRRTLDTESANQLFSILTDSYKLLKTEMDGGARGEEADWQEMRRRSQPAAAVVSSTNSKGREPGRAFNIDTFNNTFSDTRLGDENDRGYSSWMERLTPDAAPGQQKKRQEEERRRCVSETSALVASEPEALLSSTSVPHSELGAGRVKDFGRPVEVVGRRLNLGYTDYKVAHMTASCLIDPEVVRARKQFASVEEYEQARSESSVSSMTGEERAAIARRAASQAAVEDRRMTALRTRDELVSRHHAKLHPHMLT